MMVDKEYCEEDFLMLSGIQHYAFCPRQWALIHIEQQWAENYFTVEGNFMHETAHNKDFVEKRKEIIITRGMLVHSRKLGIRGECDVVEFHKEPDGIALKNYEGAFKPIPIEYKRGKPKEHDADVLQLCGQGICLEEMLCCNIPKGYLYYGETRKRVEVIFDENLRIKVKESFKKMHQLYQRRHTPKVKTTKACKSCSLAELCLPVLNKKKSVEEYLDKNLGEENI